jgi:hypothetical protein
LISTIGSTDDRVRSSKALEEYGARKIYAGGAELLLLLRQGLLQCDTLIDVKRIERLHRLESNERAPPSRRCVMHQDLATRSIVRERAPAFAYAESQVANVRVKSRDARRQSLFQRSAFRSRTVLLLHGATRWGVKEGTTDTTGGFFRHVCDGFGAG